MGVHRVRNVLTDERRADVQAFFARHIDERWKPLPVLPYDPMDQFDTQVAVVLDDSKRVVAAAHWTIDFEDVYQMQQQGQPAMAEALLRRVRILQNIAVDETHRRTGLARALVEHAEAQVRASGADFFIGVSTDGEQNAEAFRHLGFHVLQEKESLQLPLQHGVAVLPIEGRYTRWFAKYLVRS